jgi:hypothetical protein
MLFGRSLQNAMSADLGVDIDQLIVARMLSRPPEGDYARVNADFRVAADRIAGLGGVVRAGVASYIPFVAHSMARVSTPGRNSLEQLPDSVAYISGATRGYFSAMGLPLRAGAIDSSWDGRAAAHVAAVNETFAKLVWPGDRAIDKCLNIYEAGTECRKIVAVIGDARLTDLQDRAQPEVFVPLGERPGSPVIVARTRASTRAIASSVEREIRAVNRDLPYIAVDALSDLMAPQMRSWRLGSVLLGVFASFAMLVACMGVFAVAAHQVAERRKEIGIRVALGAEPLRIILMVLRHSAVLVAAGAAAGLLVAWVVSPMLAPLLLEVNPHDLNIVYAVVIALAATGTAASCWPAWSAAGERSTAILRES